VTLLLQTSSVCLSGYLSVTIVSPAKTAEPMEMPFGLWTRVGQNRSEHCRNPTNTIEPSMCAGDVALYTVRMLASVSFYQRIWRYINFYLYLYFVYVRVLWPFALICCEHNKCTRNPYRPCPVTQANSASYPEQEPSNEKWQCFLAEAGHLSGKSRAKQKQTEKQTRWRMTQSYCVTLSVLS